MGDWGEITSGRSSMGIARPLRLVIAAQRRKEDRENQRGLGVIPNGEWGTDIRNDGEKVLGRGNDFVFFFWEE